MAVLVAKKGLSELEGRVLTDGQFLAESGSQVVKVTAANTSLKRISEFVDSFGAHVAQVKIRSRYNTDQVFANFVEKTYTPVPPDTYVGIPTRMEIGQGEDAFKVIHTFVRPFESAANKVLIVLLQPNCSADIDMLVNYHS